MADKVDPFGVLGIDPTSDENAIRRAWRRAARVAHPDAGGSDARMRALNLALDEAMIRARRSGAPGDSAGPPASVADRRRRSDASWSRRDASSFTIDVLPVEAFMALEIVAAECGSLIHDEPPRMIEFTLHHSELDEGGQSWCRCELVPEAGGTTVHVTVGGEQASRVPSVESARDVLVTALNAIDWPER